MSQPPEERITDVIGDRNRTDPETLKAMRDLIDSAIPRIPEPVFLANLLPLSINDNTEKDPFHWRYAAGSMTNSVHVINAAGEILFTCPGLFPELPMVSSRGEATLSWNSLAVHTAQQNNRHPGLGEEEMYQVGANHLPEAPDALVEEHRKKWIEVWRRYGVNGFGKDEVSAAPVTALTPLSSLTELEEDDAV